MKGLALLALLAGGCAAPPSAADWIDPVECAANTAPTIGNITVNSAFDEELLAWRMCFSLDWIDPGRDDAGVLGSDAPNMHGGYFNGEFTAAAIESVWFDAAIAPVGATSGTFETGLCSEEWAPTEELLQRYVDPDAAPGDPPPDTSACADADGDGTSELADCFAGAEIHFSVRVRDACGAPSNDLTGSYTLGVGKQASTGDLPGCAAVPACPGGDEAR